MDNNTKPWFLSKGVMGALITILALAANVFGLGIGEPEIAEVVNQVVAASGAILALIGRVKATKTIGA